MRLAKTGGAVWRALREGSWIHDPRARIAACMWAAAMLPLLVAMMSTYFQDGITNGSGKVFGEDFVDCWAGARAAWQGDGAGAYDFAKHLAVVRAVAGAPTGPYLFGYPPTMMLLCAPFAALPYMLGAVVWISGGIVALYVLLRLFFDRRDALIATLAAPATFVNALFGQNGALSALFLGGGLLLLQRAPILAGLVFALLSYKPHLGLLLPVALACGGHWRAFFAAATGVILFNGASVAFAGIDAWHAAPARMAWMRDVLGYIGEGLWHRMPSTFMSARFLTRVDATTAWLIHAPAALAALVAVVSVWRRPSASFSVRSATLVLSTFIVTPYVWDNDMVVLVVMWAWRLKDGDWKPWEATALTLAVALPLILAPAATFLGLPIGPAVLLFALWAAARDVAPVEREAGATRSG